jgi:hypothetical protein
MRCYMVRNVFFLSFRRWKLKDICDRIMPAALVPRPWDFPDRPPQASGTVAAASGGDTTKAGGTKATPAAATATASGGDSAKAGTKATPAAATSTSDATKSGEASATPAAATDAKKS